MADQELLAQRFEEQRGHLRAVAYRMLGSLAEADDAIQEAWLRLSRSGSASTSMATILPCAMVNPSTETSLPSCQLSTPAAPLTSAYREDTRAGRTAAHARPPGWRPG